MIQGILIRTESSDQGTVGFLTFPVLNFSCFTIELPWRENKQNISCIPGGTYKVMYRESKKRGPCYHIIGVENRTSVLIHPGNFAGDINKGYRTHSQGCVLVGKYLGILQNQRAVLSSRFAMSDLVGVVGENTFNLTIEGN